MYNPLTLLCAFYGSRVLIKVSGSVYSFLSLNPPQDSVSVSFEGGYDNGFILGLLDLGLIYLILM